MPSALIPAGHSYRAVLLAEQLAHQRSVHPGPLVLGAAPLKPPTPASDRDRTVSRRSKPSSRTALMGEQPNPWDLLQPQDAMSRHRGAKPPRRCELLGEISLLSPEYLLSVERWPFHSEPPKLALRLQSLPPILHRPCQNSIPRYSKGSRGLFVLTRVASIFTGATVSPGLSWRQRSSRYAIRAGRNLPDKEFRYLRTVIVTAAVYRGFGSKLRTLRH